MSVLGERRTGDDWHFVIEGFVAATRRCREAGFRVLELHGGHGYLFHQFLSPLSNLRGDQYGGSLHNRARLLLDTVEAVRAEWPGLTIASPAEAREILELKGGDRVEFWRSLDNSKRGNAMNIDVLVDCKTTLGEGPLWDIEEQRLYWVDSFDGRVSRCTADQREVPAWDVPE